MKPSCPIEIVKTANGFFAAPSMRDQNTCLSYDGCYVFESMESLQKFVKEHFAPTITGAISVQPGSNVILCQTPQ